MTYIDLRSDTVTQPTEEMRKRMYEAPVGDDVYGDDPTMAELEELAAFVSGKEAAIFVPSGTFGNQLCLLTNTKRGDEVILGEDCHIVVHEVGASSVIAGVQLNMVKSDKGILNPADILSKIRGDDIHYPETGLICLENAHSTGKVIPLNIMKEIYTIAKDRNIPVHLDGARLFNAAASLGVDAKEITKYCDSVMFCLSKGLCAPVGSMVAGSHEFIKRARKNRKLMGGGLRQGGILAAAGIVALSKMKDRVYEDHKRAKYLGSLLSQIDGVEVYKDMIDINMVFFKINKLIDGNYVANEFLKRGIKINPPENGMYRFVTHYYIDDKAVETAVKTLKEVLS